MIGRVLRHPCNSHPMDTLLLFVYDNLDRFERWFDKRFGWFFTNGMKGRDRERSRDLSA